MTDPLAALPRTNAGRALLASLREHAPWFLGGSQRAELDAILAIEDEAVKSDDPIPCPLCPHHMHLHDPEGHCGGGCH